MGILPWSSARGRSHPQGGRARLSSDPRFDGTAPAHDADLGHDAELAHDPEVAAAWQAVVAVATAPARAGELGGLDRALGDFRRAVPMSTADTRDEGGRRMAPTTLGSRIGVAAAGVLLLGFGGVGAFALTSSDSPSGATAVPAASLTSGAVGPASASVPAAGQTGDESDDPGDADESGDADGSGDADESSTPKPGAAPTTAEGPDAKGPAAHGLCTAWSHAKPSKRTASHSVAFRNLVNAAGGVDEVEAYCASVPRPSTKKSDKPSTHHSGKPSGTPGSGSGHGSSHPTGKPSTVPGKPSTLPGKPSTLPATPGTQPSLPSAVPTHHSTGRVPTVTPTARR